MKLEVLGLERHFGELKAVDGLSFELQGGEIYGFVGPNGAGKTTTLRMLATLDVPTAGDALLDGVSIVDYPEVTRRKVGFMPDGLPTHSDISVLEYLDFFARCYDLRGDARRLTLEQIQAFTHLESFGDRMIDSLSKGMKQRVSLARALIHDPPLLILDEPAAGLDPRARVELRELLSALAAQGKAILISSHILAELTEICDGAVIIENGRLVRAGAIEHLRQASRQRLTVRLRCLDGRAELHRALLLRPEVQAVRTVGEELEVDLVGQDSVAAELLAALVQQGTRLVEFRQLQRGLEDVFMQMTRGDVA